MVLGARTRGDACLPGDRAWFRRIGDSVSAARRVADAYPHKTIIADTMKLLGNSGYGKPIANVDRHRGVTYCTEVGASTMINNRRFRQLDVVVDNAYEVVMNKRSVTYALPNHVGFFVLQYAKLQVQVQHQMTEQTSQRYRQGRDSGRAHQPSKRLQKESRVRVDVRAALTYFYANRVVLEDGLNTAPVDV